MATNQEGVHAAVRALTGTARSYNEDWHALFTQDGISSGAFNERLLNWINDQLGTSYSNVNSAMAAFAIEQGFTSWSSMNTFSTSLAAALFAEWADENGGITLVPEDDTIKIVDPTVPANDYNGSLNEYLRTRSFTIAQPAPKLSLQSDGVYRYQPHNLLAMSERFDSAYWSTKVDTTVVYGETAFDGTATASLCTEGVAGTATLSHTAATTGSDVPVLASADLKRGNTDWVRFTLRETAGSNGVQCYVNLSTGELGAFTGVLGSGTTYISVSISSLGNGWHRATIVGRMGTTTAKLQINSATGNNNPTRVNNATYYIARAQLNLGTEATTYVKTETHNLCLQSQTFDNASWIKTGTTATANSVVGPDGTQTADTLSETATTAVHFALQSVTVLANTSYTFYVFIKQGTNRYAQVFFDDGNNGPHLTCDLQAGTITETGTHGSGGSYVSSTVTLWSDGFYRVSITGTVPATSGRVGVIMSNSATPGWAPSYAGNTSNNLYIFGAQLALGTTPGKYSATTTAAVYESHVNLPYEWDASGNALGVDIEEARTNSIRNSTMVGASAPSTFPTNWTASNSAGCSWSVVGTGTERGIDYIDIRVQGTAGSGNPVVNFDGLTQVVATASQAWTATVFCYLVSGTLTGISSTDLVTREALAAGTLVNANGTPFTSNSTTSIIAAKRTRAVTTAGTTERIMSRFSIVEAASGAVDATFRIGWPQLKQGADINDSPIPTTTAAVTRAADTVSLATSLFPYSATAGTLYAEAQVVGSATANQHVLSVSDDTGSELLRIRLGNGSANSTFTVADGGVTQADQTIASLVVNTVYKLAGAYALNDFIHARAGSLSGGDATGTLPTVTILRLGASAANSGPLNGHISQLMYLPRRMSNADLQALTT